MLKDFIKKHSPDPQKIKSYRWLGCFGNVIDEPQLWYLTRSSVAKGFLIGLFFAFWPVPFQMFLAAAGAVYLRANLPLSISLVWITNPITIPFFFGFAYFVGLIVMGKNMNDFPESLTLEWLQNNFSILWQPFLVGCGICALTFSLVGYGFIHYFWIWKIKRAWKKRQKSRKIKC
jgi:uncharacterized protein (DUF2062 family)